MKNNTCKSFDNSILLVIIIGVTIIIYAIGVSVFLARGDDKTVGAFEAISSVTGVILSICTIFYVVKAYQQQLKQNELQNHQIEIQKKEIEDNKRDIENNRVIDAVYKQLEFTNSELKEYYNEIKEPISLVFSVDNSFNEMPLYTWIFNIMNTNYILFDNILDESFLDDKEKVVIRNIIGTNIYYKAILLFMQFHQIVKSVGGKENYINLYRSYIKNSIQESLNVADNFSSTEIQDKYNYWAIRSNELIENLFDNSKNLEMYIEKYKKKMMIYR